MVRKIIQFSQALAINANLSGFVTGRIWQGQTKRVCIPGLNCYSCPAAIGACPLGALQFSLASGSVTALAYVVGMLILFGIALGRFVCGFLCPFGLIQEIINAPFKLKRKNRPLALHLNYVFLIIFVLLLPLIAYAHTGLGSPAFCKYICPAGTLQAGVPLVLFNAHLRGAVGVLFSWKIFLALSMIIACAFIYRPFCRICPLGAIFGLFNKVAVVGMAIDVNKCTSCGGCTSSCPMHTECSASGCIRCGQCAKKCPSGAIRYTLIGKYR